MKYLFAFPFAAVLLFLQCGGVRSKIAAGIVGRPIHVIAPDVIEAKPATDASVVGNKLPMTSCDQSSTYQQSDSYNGCKTAIDGQSSVCKHGTISNTQNSPHEWWIGYLPEILELHAVKIYPRVDCCQHRMEDISIVGDDDQVCYDMKKGETFSTNHKLFICKDNFPTKSVKIMRQKDVDVSNTDRLYLSLCEVEAYGISVGNKLPMTACDQSSTFHPSDAFNGCKTAIDGMSSVCKYGTISHTLNSPQEWWIGYLPHILQLHAVNIYHRVDCCKHRMEDIAIVGDDDKVCYDMKNGETFSTKHRLFICTDRFPTKSVKIMRQRDVHVTDTDRLYLSLCEVEAYGIIRKI